MPNHSLDDFAGGDDGTADSPDAGDTNISDADDRDASMLAICRWTPEAATCPQCGESVQKRWLDGDEYVCLDCRDW